RCRLAGDERARHEVPAVAGRRTEGGKDERLPVGGHPDRRSERGQGGEAATGEDRGATGPLSVPHVVDLTVGRRQGGRGPKVFELRLFRGTPSARRGEGAEPGGFSGFSA